MPQCFQAVIESAPKTNAENQQERGPGAALSDQSGFPPLPAVLLQVLLIAQGRRQQSCAGLLLSDIRVCSRQSPLATFMPPLRLSHVVSGSCMSIHCEAHR